MPRILLTAYGPYDDWSENASWLALQEVLRELPQEDEGDEHLEITTRLYPVDFDEVRARLESDLAGRFDIALHLGQSPGAGRIELEAFGLNVGRQRDTPPEAAFALAEDGPPAYQSQLPLAHWAALLQSQGIPAGVSYHAGAYLCNAALYWTHFYCERDDLPTAATFLHLPLDTCQAVTSKDDLASLPAAESARAIRLILDDLKARFELTRVAAQTQSNPR